MLKTLAPMLATLAIATISSLAQAGGNQDFTLINETGWPIGELHITLANSDSWGGDVLGRDILLNGETTRIQFAGYHDNDCTFDLRIRKGNDGDYFVAEDLNLCTFDEFHLYTKDGRVQFRAK